MLAEAQTLDDWKSEDLLKPFYAGGKVQYSSNCVLSFLFEENVHTFAYDDSHNSELQSVRTTGPRLRNNSITQSEQISCFCMSRDGEVLATVSNGFVLKHWAVQEKECKKNIKIHKSPVICMDFDATSTLVALGSVDGAVRIWDICRGYCTHTFKSHTDIVRIVAFRQESSTINIFSGSDDGSLKCFDLVKSKCVADFKCHVGSLTAMSFSEHGNSSILATVGRDKVWTLL